MASWIHIISATLVSRSKGILITLLTWQEKGVKHAKIYTIDLRTKIPYLPAE